MPEEFSKINPGKMLKTIECEIGYDQLGSIERTLTEAIRPLLKKVGELYIEYNIRLTRELSKGRESDIHHIWNSPIKCVRLDFRYEPNSDGRREAKYAGVSFERFLKAAEEKFPHLLGNSQLFGEIMEEDLLARGGQPDSKDSNLIKSIFSEDRRLWYQKLRDDTPPPQPAIKHYVLVRFEPQQPG